MPTTFRTRPPSRSVPRLVALAAAATLLGVGTAVPAQAAPDQYAPSIGTATGTQTTTPTNVPVAIRTDKPCPAGTGVVNGFMNSTAAGIVDGVVISANSTDVGTLDTSGMPLDNNLLGLAQSSGRVLVNGRYEVSVVCFPDAFSAPTAQFDAVFTVTGGATPTAPGTSATWDVAGPVATSTALVVTPAGTAVAGAQVTLTATVTPSAAGTVQFSEVSGATPTALGAPVTVTGGTATLQTTTLAVGTRQLRATFTPADAAAFAPSTSPTVSYTITAPAPTTTTTELAGSPPSPVEAGTEVTFTAVVTPASAAGTVQFSEVSGASPVALGAPVAVSGGTATLATSSLAVGTRQVRATFTPTNAAAFTSSQSPILTYTVTAPPTPPTTTTTAITADPAGPVEAGTPVTLTATVTPAAAVGTVQFVDATSATPVSLGQPVTVSGGTAALTTSSLAVGARTLRAVFTPADAAAFTASTSPNLAFTVTAPPNPPTATTTALTVLPADTAVAGTPVTLTATVTPGDAAGTVEFTDVSGASPTPVGAPVTVVNGSATLTTSALAVGTRQLRAQFVPADAAAFAASTSATVSYTITAAPNPAVETATALEASPAGPVEAGTPVTLTATVTPSAAAGTVTFENVTGATPVAIGDAQTVAGGTASVTTSALPVGALSLRARFTPANAADFTASTSPVVAYTVTAPPTGPEATTTALTATPSGSVPAGSPVTFTATVAPSAAAGTVQFSEVSGASPVALGAPVPVSGGTAAFTTSDLSVGTRQLQAAFTPADPAAFGPSTSPVVTVTVTPVTGTAKPTTTDLRARATYGCWWRDDHGHREFESSSKRCGAGAVLRARVHPRAAGTIQFFDTFAGTSVPVTDPVPARKGRAVVVVAPLAAGEHVFTAVFTPADPAAYQPSTSEGEEVEIPQKRWRWHQ